MTISLSGSDIACLFIIVAVVAMLLGYALGLKDQRIRDLEINKEEKSNEKT